MAARFSSDVVVQHRRGLVRAVRENEVGEAKRLLEKGAHPNTISDEPHKVSISVVNFHAVCLIPTSDGADI